MKGIFQNWRISDLTREIPVGARRQEYRKDSDWPMPLLTHNYNFSKQTAGNWSGGQGVRALLEGEFPSPGLFRTSMLPSSINNVMAQINGGAGGASGAGGNDLQAHMAGVPNGQPASSGVGVDQYETAEGDVRNENANEYVVGNRKMQETHRRDRRGNPMRASLTSPPPQ